MQPLERGKSVCDYIEEFPQSSWKKLLNKMNSTIPFFALNTGHIYVRVHKVWKDTHYIIQKNHCWDLCEVFLYMFYQ